MINKIRAYTNGAIMNESNSAIWHGIDAFRNEFRSRSDWSTENDDDPLSMIFVVRDRSTDDDGNVVVPNESDAIDSAIAAMIGILSYYDANGETNERINEWIGSRIRKIVKRAHGSKWTKVLDYALGNAETPHVPACYSSARGAGVIAFAPMRVSEQPRCIKSLQVSGLELRNPDDADETTPTRTYAGCDVLNVTLDESLDMTTGKAIAQACHVVQIAFKSLDDDKYDDWRDNGFCCKVDRGVIDDASEYDVCVHDAGFTEVPSGSLTAIGKLR